MLPRKARTCTRMKQLSMVSSANCRGGSWYIQRSYLSIYDQNLCLHISATEHSQLPAKRTAHQQGQSQPLHCAQLHSIRYSQMSPLVLATIPSESCTYGPWPAQFALCHATSNTKRSVQLTWAANALGFGVWTAARAFCPTS